MGHAAISPRFAMFGECQPACTKHLARLNRAKCFETIISTSGHGSKTSKLLVFIQLLVHRISNAVFMSWHVPLIPCILRRYKLAGTAGWGSAYFLRKTTFRKICSPGAHFLRRRPLNFGFLCFRSGGRPENPFVKMVILSMVLLWKLPNVVGG